MGRRGQATDGPEIKSFGVGMTNNSVIAFQERERRDNDGGRDGGNLATRRCVDDDRRAPCSRRYVGRGLGQFVVKLLSAGARPLLDAMRQAVAYDSALPFATPDSDASLLTDLQNTNYELLSAGLGSLLDETVFSTPQSGNGGVGEHARVGPGDREHPARRPRRAAQPRRFLFLVGEGDDVVEVLDGHGFGQHVSDFIGHAHLGAPSEVVDVMLSCRPLRE